MHAQHSIASCDMRTVLGSFASGVTVVTAIGDEPLGFTCQSFTSLSLDPRLVALSPARTSVTWARSDRFAHSGTGKYAGLRWSPAPSGAPGLDGSVAWVDCTLRAEYDGGDHWVVIGEVRDLSARPDRKPLLFYRGAYRHLQPEKIRGPT